MQPLNADVWTRHIASIPHRIGHLYAGPRIGYNRGLTDTD